MSTQSGPPVRRPVQFHGRLFPSGGCAAGSIAVVAALLALTLIFDLWPVR